MDGWERVGVEVLEFKCCFLNCRNLYEFEVNRRRADISEEDLEQKLIGLATMLREAAVGELPALIGLCEIGSQEIGIRLANTLQPDCYTAIWSGSPSHNKTGLLVLCDKQLFTEGRTVIDRWTQGEQARVKWMAVRLECQRGTQGTLWFVVHHWPSPLSGEESPTARQNLWAELNSFYKREARVEADAMIMVGDFNCEPGDAPLVGQPGEVLVTTRQREPVVRGWRDGLILYNPMWRFMGEEHPYEDTLELGYTPTRPLGTYFRSGQSGAWRMLDQMIVSRAVLIGPHFQLLERTIRISSHRSEFSDHSAVGATICIEER